MREWERGRDLDAWMDALAWALGRRYGCYLRDWKRNLFLFNSFFRLGVWPF